MRSEHELPLAHGLACLQAACLPELSLIFEINQELPNIPHGTVPPPRPTLSLAESKPASFGTLSALPQNTRTYMTCPALAPVGQEEGQEAVCPTIGCGLRPEVGATLPKAHGSSSQLPGRVFRVLPDLLRLFCLFYDHLLISSSLTHRCSPASAITGPPSPAEP